MRTGNRLFVIAAQLVLLVALLYSAPFTAKEKVEPGWDYGVIGRAPLWSDGPGVPEWYVHGEVRWEAEHKIVPGLTGLVPVIVLASMTLLQIVVLAAGKAGGRLFGCAGLMLLVLVLLFYLGGRALDAAMPGSAAAILEIPAADDTDRYFLRASGGNSSVEFHLLGPPAGSGKRPYLDSTTYYLKAAPYEVRVNAAGTRFLPVDGRGYATEVLNLEGRGNRPGWGPILEELREEFGEGIRGFAERR